LMHAEERVEGFMQRIATLQTELDSKTELSEEYKARLDKAQNYAMKVKMEAEMKVKEQMKKVWELERTLQEKDSAVESLKQELHEASQAALNLVEPSEIEEMQRNMDLLNAQKMQKEEEASHMRADLLAQQMVNASLVEQKRDLDNKNRELRQDAVTRQSYENSVQQKNVQATEQKLKETERNYETMKQTFQNTAKENVELKRELSETVQIERAAKDEVRRLTALANELENRLAEADNQALQTTEMLAKVKEEARIEAMKIVSETKERAKRAESLLMKERTESAVTYSSLELQLGSLQMELENEKKQTSILFSELDLKKEKLTTVQSEFEEREARAVERVREDFHYQMRALEEKVLIAEAATRDAEMRAEALQQLAEKAEDDSARTFDAAVKAVTEATNNSAIAAAMAASTTSAEPVNASQSSSVDAPVPPSTNTTPLSKMKKADLVAACEAMDLDAAGTVPVLRARLRAAGYNSQK
jgi:myosin heavy subunit